MPPARFAPARRSRSTRAPARRAIASWCVLPVCLGQFRSNRGGSKPSFRRTQTLVQTTGLWLYPPRSRPPSTSVEAARTGRRRGLTELSSLEEAPVRAVFFSTRGWTSTIVSIVRDRAGPPYGGCRRPFQACGFRAIETHAIKPPARFQEFTWPPLLLPRPRAKILPQCSMRHSAKAICRKAPSSKARSSVSKRTWR